MKNNNWFEVQCDGLVGPSHHYGGLAQGNIASTKNKNIVSNPKKAALQGLEKMKFVASLGVKQIIIPPHPRPNMSFLQKGLISEAYSAANMWVANMATISPTPDTQDGGLHITPANLISNEHRKQEDDFSYKLLKKIFGEIANIHQPLRGELRLADEGAANHMRLCESHGKSGVNIFVYGREFDNKQDILPVKYQPRQTKEAFCAISESHKLSDDNTVFIKQNPEAIDAGVFHNDVIAMSNENLLIYHEKAFVDSDAKIAEIKAKFGNSELNIMCISEKELPIAMAVKSYFFNSQILSLPNGEMAIIAPKESEDIEITKKLFDKIISDSDNSVAEVHYFNLRESMQNGGGPACLRLRVVMNDDDFDEIPQEFIYTEKLHKILSNIIENKYPDYITANSLKNKNFIAICKNINLEIYKCFNIESLL